VSSKSFGMHVAQMAGLPQDLVQKAQQMSEQFENDLKSIQVKKSISSLNKAVERLASI
jgi:DNA mismatch repair ATPase MutS